jgi:signal transduction histidine kinase
VRQTVDETIACLARDPRKDGLELTIDVDEDLKVAMSALNLQQVLLNLILNAKKAMRRGGALTIRASAEGEMVMIDVSDSGPGIPPEIVDRLFQPFVTHRIGSGPELMEQKGTGLGLCICRDLLRHAGGSISVDSVAGQGATFHIVVPRAAAMSEAA